jgi:hypothetical protein
VVQELLDKEMLEEATAVVNLVVFILVEAVAVLALLVELVQLVAVVLAE